MTKTEELRTILTEDQILECLFLLEKNRKMEASRILAKYLYNETEGATNVGTLSAFQILLEVQKEWFTNPTKK